MAVQSSLLPEELADPDFSTAHVSPLILAATDFNAVPICIVFKLDPAGAKVAGKIAEY
jgi:hypothetical protein